MRSQTDGCFLASAVPRTGSDSDSAGGHPGPEALLDELIVHEPVRVAGRRNLILLRAVILVLLGRGSGTGGRPWPFGLLEVALGGIALLSYRITPRAIHRANRFSFGPIASVAVIFAGIFVTMTQPLLMLNARAAEIGISGFWQYFWASGVLSSTLDNRGGAEAAAAGPVCRRTAERS